MRYIEDYLTKIYERLVDNIDRSDSICCLKNVNYNTDTLPDYSDPMVQRYYILRYHFAYAFEYEYMFNKVIDDYISKGKIRILSIGCGNGIDYWSTRRVIDKKNAAIDIEYVGIDAVNWRDKILPASNDSVEYFECDLKDINQIIGRFEPDVLVFPKSISEITRVGIEALAASVNFPNKFYMFVSLRETDSNMDVDMRKTANIVERFSKLDFSTNGDYNRYTYFTDSCCGIKGIYYDYNYPDKVMNFLSELNTECPNYIETGKNCEPSCITKLKRMPILTVNHIKYQIIKFEKEAEK